MVKVKFRKTKRISKKQREYILINTWLIIKLIRHLEYILIFLVDRIVLLLGVNIILYFGKDIMYELINHYIYIIGLHLFDLFVMIIFILL